MKNLLTITILSFFAISLQAQRVKRKGTTPYDITKNKKAASKALYSNEQFYGKWQEVKRVTINKEKAAEIVDTFYLHFTDDGKVDSREGNNFNEKGAAEIDDTNTLIVAGNIYTIKDVSENEMVLNDNEKYIHTFQKVDSFWFDKVGKLTVAIDTFKTVTQFNINNLIGDWLVYKREAKPGIIKLPTMFIKYLKIQTKTNETTLTGQITVYQKDKSEELPCTITAFNTGMQITAGDYNWYLPIYKADGKELVFGNIELMLNYCRPL